MDRVRTEHVISMVAHMGNTIIENEVYFCELDAVAGDGDFGMSVAKGFKQLKLEWETLNKEDVGSFLKECGMIITEHCGGASGPIWGSAFRGAGKYAKDKTTLTVLEFGEMLEAAVLAIQKRGNAKLGDKTLLDALIPTADAIKSVNDDFKKALKVGAAAAVEGAEKTKTMVASRGRASYVGERSLDHPDAGAMALGVIFSSIADNLEHIL